MATGRLGFGPVQVALIVGLELLVLGAYFIWRRDSLLLLSLGGALAVVGGLLALPGGPGRSAAALLGARLGFATRRHVGAGAAARAQASSGRDHQGHVVGLLEAPPTVISAVRLTRPRQRVLVEAGAQTVPVRAMYAAVQPLGIPLDSLTVLARPAAHQESEIVVVARLVPQVAATAIEVRGGGRTGLEAALAALAAAVAHAGRQAGFTATVLSAEDVSRELAQVLAGAATDPTTWTESWTDVSTGDRIHRCALVTQVPASADLRAFSAAGGPGAQTGAVLSVRLAPADGGVRARVLARASDRGAGELGGRLKVLVDKGRTGVVARPAHGWQRTAYLETTLLGEGAAPARDVQGERSLGGWMSVPTADLDRLAPVLANEGVPFGVTATGAQLALDLIGSTPRRLVVIGDAMVAGAVAAGVARAGGGVVVVSARPAPWHALVRTHALEGRLTVVQPGARPDALSAPPALIVVEGPLSDVDAWRAQSSVLLIRGTLDQVEEGLLGRSALVLLSASALTSPARAAALVGVSEESMVAALPQQSEVMAIEAGQVHRVRVA